MKRRTTAIAAARSLLPLGQPLLLGSTTALATAVVVLSTQAAHAQSADDFLKQASDLQGEKGLEEEMIRLANKALAIRESNEGYFHRAYAKDE